MKKKFYVYAGYYELYISSEPMPAPYMFQRWFWKIERAIKYAESWDDTIQYCENVKDDLPTMLAEMLEQDEYEYFKF